MPTLEYARLFPSVVLPTALGTRLPPDETMDRQRGGGPGLAVALPVKGEYLIRDVVALAALAPHRTTDCAHCALARSLLVAVNSLYYSKPEV